MNGCARRASSSRPDARATTPTCRCRRASTSESTAVPLKRSMTTVFVSRGSTRSSKRSSIPASSAGREAQERGAAGQDRRRAAAGARSPRRSGGAGARGASALGPGRGRSRRRCRARRYRRRGCRARSSSSSSARRPCRLLRHVDPACLLDGEAVGEVVADRAVAGDPLGELDAGVDVASLEEPLDAAVSEPQPRLHLEDRLADDREAEVPRLDEPRVDRPDRDLVDAGSLDLTKGNGPASSASAVAARRRAASGASPRGQC